MRSTGQVHTARPADDHTVRVIPCHFGAIISAEFPFVLRQCRDSLCTEFFVISSMCPMLSLSSSGLFYIPADKAADKARRHRSALHSANRHNACSRRTFIDCCQGGLRMTLTKSTSFYSRHAFSRRRPLDLGRGGDTRAYGRKPKVGSPVVLTGLGCIAVQATSCFFDRKGYPAGERPGDILNDTQPLAPLARVIKRCTWS